MSTTKTLMKSAIVYFFGNILSRMIVFFMLPIYTTYISPENYGYFDLTVNYITIITSILFLDIWCGIMRFMFDSEEKLDKLKTIYSSLPIYGASLCFYFVAFIALNAFIKIQYFPLVLLYGTLTTLQNLYGYVVRAFGKSVLYATSGLICTAITVMINIIMIVGLNKSYWSLYIAFSVGIFAQIIMMEISVKLIPNFSMKLIDKTLLKQLFRFSLPLCINSVAYCFLTSFNRIVIVHVLGEAQNGYFAIANKFTVLINLIGTCFFLAWQESVFKQEGEHMGSSEYYSKAAHLYIRFLLMGTVCMIPLIGIVFQFIINDAYHSAKLLVPLSLLGISVSLYSTFIGSIFNALKQSRIISISSIIASTVSVISLYLLIYQIGVQAATIAFLIGYSVNAAIRVLLLRKKINFQFAVKPLLLYIPIFAGVTYVFQTQGILANALALLATGGITLIVFRDLIKTIVTRIRLKRKHPKGVEMV